MLRYVITCAVAFALYPFAAVAEEPRVKIEDVAGLNMSCHPDRPKSVGSYLSTYKNCSGGDTPHKCKVFMIAGDCFVLLIYDAKGLIVQIDVITRGTRGIFWQKNAAMSSTQKGR